MEAPGWQVCLTSWRLISAVKLRRVGMEASACEVGGQLLASAYARLADPCYRLKTVLLGRLRRCRITWLAMRYGRTLTEHINLTGDYLWRSSTNVGAGKFRPLRPLPPA